VVSYTSLAVFSVPSFGNQVIESSKITQKALFFRLGWQSWGQGFDPPQFHQNKQSWSSFDRLFYFYEWDRTKGCLREKISLMFRESPREGEPFREAKRVRFPLSSTKTKPVYTFAHPDESIQPATP
jgi:hypothetical protein